VSQGEIFLDSEGNQYFDRCHIREQCEEGQNPAENDLSSKLMGLYDLKPKTVLDIGCSNGFRLEGMRNTLGAQCFGLEPGIDAIEDGRKRFPNLNLQQGLCSNIPWDRSFELIVVNFVLHWVERDAIDRCINEIDRVLESGGFLLLGDFFPDHAHDNDYHHLPGKIRTFKEQYFERFTERGYTHLAHLSTHHSHLKTVQVCSDPIERVIVSLLQKG
jgi:SAM-dependent methyltransferase